MKPVIIDRGRGPEIEGTRITVYDILDYSQAGHHPAYIATVLGISSPEVLAALQYIEEHKEEVLADYREMVEQARRGNPPEVEAKLAVSREKLQALLQKLRSPQSQEANDAGNSGGH